MTFAVIKTGGKQYKVTAGQLLKVEKLAHKAGEQIEFKDVLLTSDDKETKVGTPHVKGALVSAEVVNEGRAKKVLVIKFKAKSNYRKKIGHRQPYTTLKITAIKG